MSEMKYCQGPLCHTYHTKDRIRGSKGDKHYQTRKKSFLPYGDEWCSMQCYNDWLNKFGTRAVDHFGRLHEPKRQDASNAWYKDYRWDRARMVNGRASYVHYFINDLLGQRILITQQQYDDRNLTEPPTTR